MKFKFVYSLILVLFICEAQAQKKFQIKEVTAYMSEGENPGLQVYIPDAQVKDVESSWKDFAKDHKTKLKSLKSFPGEFILDDASLEEISKNTVDIHTLIRQVSNGVDITVFFNLGGVYVSSELTPQQFPQAKLIVNKVVLDVAGELILEEIKLNEKKLGGLEKEFENMLSEQKNLEESVKKKESSIVEFENSVQKLKTSQESIGKDIITQEDEIKAKRSDMEAFDLEALEDQIANLRKEQKNIDSDKEKASSSIVKKKKEIEKLQAEISGLEADILSYDKSRLEKEEGIVAAQEEIDNNNLEERVKEIDMLEEQLKSKKAEAEKVRKDIEKSAASIKSASADISKSRSAIEKNLSEQQLKSKELGSQKAVLEDLREILRSLEK